MTHILITGGAGFIGSHLAHRFAADGHGVTVLDALIPQVHGDDPWTTSPLVSSVREVATVLQGSVTNAADLRRALDGAEVVVHLAAETGTGQSMYEIDRYTRANVGGTSTLLDLLTNHPHDVSRLVVASSRSIYGEGAYRTGDGTTVYPGPRADADLAQGDYEVHGAGPAPLVMIPTAEDAVLHPSSVYGITKQMQEALVLAVGPAIGVEAVALRYQNVFGPGQSLRNAYTGIISIFSTLIRRGEEIDVFEDGLESRDFVYIDDVVAATAAAALLPGVPHGAINVGSGVATTVHDVVAALSAAFDVPVSSRVTGRYRLGDIRHNVADVALAAEVLGFRPAVSFGDGVVRFVDWVLTQPVEGETYRRSLEELAARGLLR